MNFQIVKSIFNKKNLVLIVWFRIIFFNRWQSDLFKDTKISVLLGVTVEQKKYILKLLLMIFHKKVEKKTFFSTEFHKNMPIQITIWNSIC